MHNKPGILKLAKPIPYHGLSAIKHGKNSDWNNHPIHKQQQLYKKLFDSTKPLNIKSNI